MKKLMSVAIIVVIVAAMMVPMWASANAISPNTNMWVNCRNGKSLNLREQPGTGSKVICQLKCGTEVTILGFVGNGWAQVTVTKGGQTGYVMANFLQDKKPGKYEITEREDDFRAVTPYMATAKALNAKTDRSVGLRVMPNKTANAIRRLTAGDEVKVIAQGRDWCEVIDQQTGQTGYVASSYLQAV